jgi:hypothetical protein
MSSAGSSDSDDDYTNLSNVSSSTNFLSEAGNEDDVVLKYTEIAHRTFFPTQRRESVSYDLLLQNVSQRILTARSLNQTPRYNRSDFEDAMKLYGDQSKGL